ncbi:MAG: hypothetical protein DRH12_09575 [Deltaproteobacteria bacterium]|nr:MAG: hypothetical protein DRH12_09575 [Deltaproteobacteria bacterium]RLB82667.1 MAG: hypothetical protein DRH15_05930 [Deltaproteobacteria bacterium]
MAKAHRYIAPTLGGLVFLAALFVLRHELKAYDVVDIAARVKAMPTTSALIAFLLTAANYFIMTGYDYLALRYIHKPLHYAKIVLVSFIGYSFSNNLGLSMVAGGSVRYRLYSGWGLSPGEVARVIAFCIMTLWLGFFALCALVFLYEPMTLPQALHLPFTSARPIGFILLALVIAYLLGCSVWRDRLKIASWNLRLPSAKYFVPQMTVAFIHWGLAGGVVYSLLPKTPDLTYAGFMSIYLLAQLGGLLSQVPGGLGVFESIIVVLLSSRIPSPALLGSLLVFRGVYYICPLIVASVLFAAQELFQKRHTIKAAARALKR